MGYPKPACDLLMLQDVTPSHKGLAPIGRQRLADGDASGIFSCITLLFNTKNLYFKHFFRAFSKVCTCSCWAHTKYILQGGVRWYANCAPRLRGSHRSSVSFGQERSPIPKYRNAPTTCTNR